MSCEVLDEVTLGAREIVTVTEEDKVCVTLGARARVADVNASVTMGAPKRVADSDSVTLGSRERGADSNSDAGTGSEGKMILPFSSLLISLNTSEARYSSILVIREPGEVDAGLIDWL